MRLPEIISMNSSETSYVNQLHLTRGTLLVWYENHSETLGFSGLCRVEMPNKETGITVEEGVLRVDSGLFHVSA